MRRQRRFQQGGRSPPSFSGPGVMEPVVCGVSGAETGLPAPLPEAWPMALCTFLLGQRFHNNLPLSNASRTTRNTYMYSSL